MGKCKMGEAGEWESVRWEKQENGRCHLDYCLLEKK